MSSIVQNQCKYNDACFEESSTHCENHSLFSTGLPPLSITQTEITKFEITTKEVLRGGGELAEQYQETHCVRSLSKRTLLDENLILLFKVQLITIQSTRE
jgi:hypothetical protein